MSLHAVLCSAWNTGITPLTGRGAVLHWLVHPPTPPVLLSIPHTPVYHPTPGVAFPPARSCRDEEAVCSSGQCIPRGYLCDGELDCVDGSDELDCRKFVTLATQSPCEPNEFRCVNGRCTLKLWYCDGDNDCGDNSDENSCRECPCIQATTVMTSVTVKMVLMRMDVVSTLHNCQLDLLIFFNLFFSSSLYVIYSLILMIIN
uniref:Uncharacterized protein n=1 Tax=Eptatretus burgeri TaxID=7764 RepID=A0A8C4PZU2_EPTBU